MHLAFVALIFCSVFLVSDALLFPDIDPFSFFPGHDENYPEVYMDVPGMIRNQGYPAEVYPVETADGYIIQIHRIPSGKNEPTPNTSQKPVVFLQHGLMCSSSNWVANLPNESFGFILADAGFDVWMGNVRGNTYGLQNKYYSTDSDEFWDFSFDKMAEYDLPAMLDFVLKTTSQTSLHYLGHSQGTTMGFAEFSTNKELAAKVKKFYALAPVARIGYAKSPFFVPGDSDSSIELTHEFLGKRGVLPSTYNMMKDWFSVHVCTNVVGRALGVGLIFMLCGPTDGLNVTRLPVYYSHTPSDTSVKDVIHWLQLFHSKKFQKYDYGTENIKYYGKDDPPTYNLQEVDLPVALYSGSDDWLADPRDVAYLATQLRDMTHDEIPGWDHVDFIWGMQAPTLYHKIINDIKSTLTE
ncbi:gastric triacylglycerol lipase-like [Montipora capricornis]|uniref:gastric triacylglycerol lipase-like n=1 Tax=Montipora capricornis TaxID=246305 RepID=UPI0035F20C34